jgi:hypothetical protein
MATTKHKPKPSTRSRSQQRFTRQARDEAFLRFNPERSALRSALSDAADQLAQEVGTARGTAEGVKQTARASIPQFQSIYGQAQSDVGQGEQDLMAATGGAPIAPAAARDAVGAQRRLSESLAGALSEAQSRQTEAQSGASFAINQAQDRYGRNVQKVQTRLGDLSAEEGRFVSGRLGDLLGAQAQRQFTATQKAKDRAVTRHGQGLSHEDRHRAATLSHKDRVAAAKAKATADAAKKKANPTLPGGVKPREASAQATFRNDVTSAIQAVKPLAAKLTRDKARKLFLSGASKPAEVDEVEYQKQLAKGKSTSEAKRLATKPAVTVKAIPELTLRVAFDMIYDGHLSKETVDALHKGGILVKQMPYTTNRAAARPGGVARPPTAAQRAQRARDRKLAGVIPAAPFGGG